MSTEYPPTLREAANVMDLGFFNGAGAPYISYWPEHDLQAKLKNEILGPAFNLMAAGFCAVCPLNEKSPNFEKIIMDGKPVVCQTLQPCCGADEETFYTSGDADIRASSDYASGNSRPEKRDVFTQLIESKAVCLNNNVRTVPHIPLSRR